MTSVPLSNISVEVPNHPLPLCMRLARFRARPGKRVMVRPTLPTLIPVLPVIGAAGLVIGRRRDRRAV